MFNLYFADNKEAIETVGAFNDFNKSTVVS